MKRTFICLVTLFIVCYGYEGYKLYNNLRPLVGLHTGKLSDIAAKVTSLPLDTNEVVCIQKPSRIQLYDESVYLIDNHILHCFHINGGYIGQITNPEEIRVTDYIIDPQNKQLIILGNEDDVFYCNLNGDIFYSIKFPFENEYTHLHAVNYHDGRIWVVEEIESSLLGQLEKVIVEYDISFNKQHTYTLGYTHTEYRDDLLCMMNPCFSVAPDTGEIYVYSSPVSPEYLLQDTLAIRSCRNPAFYQLVADIPVFPVHMGKRFYISSFEFGDGGDMGHFFCYDSHKNRYWDLEKGMTDDLYGTGLIRNVEPVDLTGERYWYVANETSDMPVLFIMELKS